MAPTGTKSPMSKLQKLPISLVYPFLVINIVINNGNNKIVIKMFMIKITVTILTFF